MNPYHFRLNMLLGYAGRRRDGVEFCKGASLQAMDGALKTSGVRNHSFDIATRTFSRPSSRLQNEINRR
jgi:hypothetical protein